NYSVREEFVLLLEVSTPSPMSNIEQELASDVPPWLQRLLEARKRAGLTQEELGRRIGKSQKTVNGYEHGRKPNVSIYRQIAAACDVSETWLILGEGAAERQK